MNSEHFEKACHHILKGISDSEDIKREGLQETPERFARAFTHYLGGYEHNPLNILKAFKDGSSNYDEMVCQTNIPVYSMCVVGSTFVETPKGLIPISQLTTGDWVYCVDEQTMQLHLRQCENPRVTRKNAKLVRVYTDNDTVLCTPDHRFLTYNRGWVEAQHLTSGDSLLSLYRTSTKLKTDKAKYQDRRDALSLGCYLNRGQGDHTVLGVEEGRWREDVWCMTVPDFPNFFANGMLVHNCEHHFAPFFGVAHIAYVPNGSVVGLSKLARVVDVFSKRLQVQERLTVQIAEALRDVLNPHGVAVMLQCRHMCMEMRGIKVQGVLTTTSKMTGYFLDNVSTRQEFLALLPK